MAAADRTHHHVPLLGRRRGPRTTRSARSPSAPAAQTTLEAKVQTSPNVPQYGYRDYWGTQVVAFNVDGPTTSCTVHGAALVETQPPAEPPDATWAEVAAASPTGLPSS